MHCCWTRRPTPQPHTSQGAKSNKHPLKEEQLNKKEGGKASESYLPLIHTPSIEQFLEEGAVEAPSEAGWKMESSTMVTQLAESLSLMR